MARIEDVVKVEINRLTNSVTTRDLETILVLTEHDVFSADSLKYRIYTDTKDMLEDGFTTTDNAYIMVSRIFAQDPRPTKVLVGTKATAESYLEALVKQQSVYNKFFYVITDATEVTDKEAIADYVETQNRLFYVFSEQGNATINTTLFQKLKEKSYVRSFGTHYRNDDNKFIEAAWVGRFSSEPIGSTVWIYKSLAGVLPDTYSATETTLLNENNATFYTTVEDDPVVFGYGKTCGGEWIDVMTGVTWLEIRMSERVWNLIKSIKKIAFTNAGIQMIVSVVREILAEAVEREILTDEDEIIVTYPNANNIPSSIRAGRVLTGIKFSARLAGAIIIVDKIQGTVYA